ncbi:MAG: hypothetical protein GY913_29570 [Proteobacteria bacterium]|nr:hypothetical protein [Pseudomonadota bacterium]MCP4921065.1 hypothetical protein [Pseudomonadota bacterium]
MLSGFDQERDQDWEVHADSDELASGAWTRTVERAGQDVVTRRTGQVVSQDDNSVGFVDERTYRCDDEGVWWLGRELTLELPDRTSIESTVWEEPPLVLRAGAGAADSWSGHEVYVLTINGEPDAPFSQDYEIELGPPLLLTVPAGTFEVLEWRKGGQVQLLAEGVGVVRDLDGELVSR